jgi:hypothetical protein
MTALTEVTVRPITGPHELDLFLRIPYVLNVEVADDLDAGRRRAEWMWVALRDERAVARLAWWGRAGDPAPQVMDVFDLADAADTAALADQIEIGVLLLQTATSRVVPSGTRPPDYSRYLSANWHDDSAERRAVEARMTALERTGAELFVERLRMEWRPASPAPTARARLC